MTRVVLGRHAHRDLRDAIAWISKDNPHAAVSLRTALSQAIDLIGRYPAVGIRRPDVTRLDLRFLVLSGFPYLVAYRPTSSPIRIIRILHGARDLPAVLREFAPEH